MKSADTIKNNSVLENQEIYQQDHMQKQEQTHQLIEFHNKNNKNLNKQQKSSIINIIDISLIIICVLIAIVTMSIQIFIHQKVQQKNKLIQARKQYIEQKDRWTQIYVQQFFNTLKNANIGKKLPNAYKFIIVKQQYNYILNMSQNSCKQYRFMKYDGKKSQNYLQSVEENKSADQVQITSSDYDIQQNQKQEQREVARINNQQMKFANKKQLFHPIAGITQQKIANAKIYDKFSEKLSWLTTTQSMKQYQYYQKVYKIGQYKQLPICVVVPTFNNEQNNRYKRNLDSILQQNYTNYHIVIMQDASTDRTASLIDNYVKQIQAQLQKLGKKIKIDIFHNDIQKRAMPNLRKAALQYCKYNQIFIIVDGDDRLIGRQVFKLFNSQYQSKDTWFVYSNFITFVGSVGFSRPIKHQIMELNSYRKTNFVTSHLRSFYTKLFQLIKQQDLKDNKNQYFRAANDVAICTPILQMSQKRVTYIPQITYLYNSNTGLNNQIIRTKEQMDNTKLIRNRESYKPLQELFNT